MTKSEKLAIALWEGISPWNGGKRVSPETWFNACERNREMMGPTFSLGYGISPDEVAEAAIEARKNNGVV